MSQLATRSPNTDLALRDDMPLAEAAKVFHASGLFSDTRDAAQAMVKIKAGQEIGVGPFASMSGIFVIKGKVTYGASLMASRVKASGRYDYQVLKLDEGGCSIQFFDKGKPCGPPSTFTTADAVRAGLAAGDNYRKWPKAMYFSRAVSAGIRAFCPDVLNGAPAYAPEDFGAVVRPDGTLDAPTPQRAPIARRRSVVEDLNAEVAGATTTDPADVGGSPAPDESQAPPDLTWAEFKPLADAKAMSLGWSPSELDTALAKAAKAKGERSHLAASAEFYAGFLGAMGSERMDKLRK